MPVIPCTAHYTVPPGFLDDVYEILLKVKATQLDERDKVVCLSYDAVHLKKDLSYDSTEDKFIGPHSRANVMLLRGLFKNYKIPIWYKFDHVLSSDELIEIIKKVESAGYHVVAVTADMAKENQKCAKDLGVTQNDPRFENPCRPGSHIHWFCDVCHLSSV